MPKYTLTLPEIVAILETVGVPAALRAKVERQATAVLDKRPTFTDADEHFEVASGYGARSKQPHVTFKTGPLEYQLEPKKAQEVAQMLLTGAEAAVSDAIVLKFIADRVGITDEQRLAMILLDLREYRQGSRDTVYPQ